MGLRSAAAACIILGGFLASTAFLAVPGIFGLVAVMLPTAFATDEPLRTVAIPYLIVYIAVASYFCIRWWTATPTDQRFNATRDLRRHLESSEW